MKIIQIGKWAGLCGLSIIVAATILAVCVLLMIPVGALALVFIIWELSHDTSRTECIVRRRIY